MKFGQLVKYSASNFLGNHAENEAERPVPDVFMVFKKALYKVKASVQHLSFNIFW